MNYFCYWLFFCTRKGGYDACYVVPCSNVGFSAAFPITAWLGVLCDANVFASIYLFPAAV